VSGPQWVQCVTRTPEKDRELQVTTRARKVPPAAEVCSPTRILRGKLGFPAEYGLGSRPDQISLWIASDRVASSPSSELARIGSDEQTKDDLDDRDELDLECPEIFGSFGTLVPRSFEILPRQISVI